MLAGIEYCNETFTRKKTNKSAKTAFVHAHKLICASSRVQVESLYCSAAVLALLLGFVIVGNTDPHQCLYASYSYTVSLSIRRTANKLIPL